MDTSMTILRGEQMIATDIARFVGAGTAEDPFVVSFDPIDKENPLEYSSAKKWI